MDKIPFCLRASSLLDLEQKWPVFQCRHIGAENSLTFLVWFPTLRPILMNPPETLDGFWLGKL